MLKRNYATRSIRSFQSRSLTPEFSKFPVGALAITIVSPYSRVNLHSVAIAISVYSINFIESSIKPFQMPRNRGFTTLSLENMAVYLTVKIIGRVVARLRYSRCDMIMVTPTLLSKGCGCLPLKTVQLPTWTIMARLYVSLTVASLYQPQFFDALEHSLIVPKKSNAYSSPLFPR